MKLDHRKLLRLAATGGTGLALAQSAQAATVLTGSGLPNNTTIPANHGSNEVGTPNVALTWDADWDAYSGWPNSGADGAYQHDNASGIAQTIVFTPDAGWNVALTQLDVNVWAGGGNTDVDWTVTGSSSGSLGGGTWSTLDGAVTTYPIGIIGVGAEALTLSLTQTSGSASYLAMDNISFDQVAVPEPSTSLLGLVGLGALVLRRRK